MFILFFCYAKVGKRIKNVLFKAVKQRKMSN